MKLAITAGAVSICAMLASGTATYFLSEPSVDDFTTILSENVTSQYLSTQTESEITSDGIKDEKKSVKSGRQAKSDEFFGHGGFKNNPHLVQEIEAFAQYGLTFDNEADYLIFNGKRVKLFVNKSSNRSNVMIDEEGEINIKSVYDENDNLIGLEEMSAEEYAEYEAQLNSDYYSFGFDSKPRNGCFGFMNEKNQLLGFTEFGIVFNEEANAYYYDGKKIGMIICNLKTMLLSEDGEINIKAIYDENNELTGFEEMSDDEYNEAKKQIENSKFKLPSFNFSFDSETFPFNGEAKFNTEINFSDDYEQYGIKYENGAFYYNGKKIGLIAFNSRVIMFRGDGEINLKAVYNDNNELEGFEEMSEVEYSEYSAKSENEIIKIKERINGIFKDFESRIKEFADSESTEATDSLVSIEGDNL